MNTYTVFIGGWDEPEPDWVIERVSGLTWDQAIAKLESYFRLYADDDTDFSQQAGKNALIALAAATPGYFETDIEGNDCLIFEGDAPPRP